MSTNFLLLNDAKTEFMLLSSKNFTPENCPLPSVKIGDEVVDCSTGAKNLGVLFDSSLSMENHIANVSRTCFYHLRNISRIRSYLSQSDTEKIVHALVSSRLDSCNSLLAGLPACRLKPLVRVQNTACRLIVGARKFDHITEHLIGLHWLPIPQRIEFKILLLVFKSLQGLAPDYLCELIKWHIPSRSLRSADCFLAAEKSVKMSRTNGRDSKVQFKNRAFENLGPRLFNALPLFIRSSQTVEIFKNRLKTHLFKSAYDI